MRSREQLGHASGGEERRQQLESINRDLTGKF